MKKAMFNWSTGKDSALALYKILQSGEYSIETLLTSVNEHYQRVSMHGVRVELLEQQAASIGLPLTKVLIPEMPDMETYEREMFNMLNHLRSQGITHSVFGDIFLEDLRKYREQQLAKVDLQGVFPLWKQPTVELLREFLSLGFKTVITCVNDAFLDRSYAGRIIDEKFLNDLPENVDPCGENGEFHTFTFDGPIFRSPIEFTVGEIVHRKYEAPEKNDASSYNCESDQEDPFVNGFWYADLIPF